MKRLIFILILLQSSVQLSGYEIFPLELDRDEKVVFSIEHPQAGKVTLAGNFNNWDKTGTVLEKDEMGIWSIPVTLSPGRYEYKFVIDDEQWIPSDNIVFELKIIHGKMVLEGGESFKVTYVKKANIKGSDRIFLNGHYLFLALPYYDFSKNRGSSLMEKHILELEPHIYINENVFLDTLLSLDTSLSGGLGLYQSKLALHTKMFSLLFFNHCPSFGLYDPLHSLDSIIYSSGYARFVFPVEFYDTRQESSQLGYNYRGIAAQILSRYFEFKGFFARSLFKNFDVLGGVLKRDFGRAKIGLLGMVKKGILEGNDYPRPDASDWINSPISDGRLQIEQNSLFLEDDEFNLSRFGVMGHLQIVDFLDLFTEYVIKNKQGGFYMKTVLGDGYDLPVDYASYSSTYPKNIYFYETSFSGEEFIIGLRTGIKNIKEELSFQLDSIRLSPGFLDSITPSVMTFRSITKTKFKVAFIPFFWDIQIDLVQADETVRFFNYPVYFDENNFYNRTLFGCYKKFVARNNVKIEPVKDIHVLIDLWFNRYYQRDIFFGQDKKWQSGTGEGHLVLVYNLTARWDVKTALRIKHYDYSEFIEKGVFYSFDRTFYNVYAGCLWKVINRFRITLGYGIDFEIDEKHRDGFAYYLNDQVSKKWPFFKEAEEKLSGQHFITLKGEFSF
ncbi:MAG: hypothetical protein JW827_07285 [Spirochaetes bacterium]|nr:hypothetical protein [Spirochaetota bacterium]